jgi:hypothetical protein
MSTQPVSAVAEPQRSPGDERLAAVPRTRALSSQEFAGPLPILGSALIPGVLSLNVTWVTSRLPNMPEHHRLFEERRNLRRTLADAIEVLRKHCDFGEEDRAQIRIGPLPLPSTELVGLVDVMFTDLVRDKIYIVSLPSSARFRAFCSGASRRDHFEISRLDGAVVKGSGAVLLTDGVNLHAVEVIPTHLPYEPTELDWRIVCSTIAIIGAEERCYRSLRTGLPFPQRDMVPDWRAIDCSRLFGLELPPLKRLAHDIREKDWTLRKLSDQAIADALRKFGMRVPKSRPRGS